MSNFHGLSTEAGFKGLLYTRLGDSVSQTGRHVWHMQLEEQKLVKQVFDDCKVKMELWLFEQMINIMSPALANVRSLTEPYIQGKVDDSWADSSSGSNM